MLKKDRQSAILSLISTKSIGTQEMLLDELKKAGFDTTQATISRDIKELSLLKIVDSNGTYKYDIPSHIRDKDKSPSELLSSIIKEAVVSINFAVNIVVIKCHTGMAQAVCARLDKSNIMSVVGTIAGDDTIFVVTKSETLAIELVNLLKGLLID